MNTKANQHHWEYSNKNVYEYFLELFKNKTFYWQDFHQASVLCNIDKNSTSDVQTGIESLKQFGKMLLHDSYRSLKLAALPSPSKITVSLSDAIIQRTSSREDMVTSVLSIQDLSDFLYYGYGKKSNGFRNIPSAGALYPIDIYIYCNSVESTKPGLYYYVPEEHGLKKISQEKELENLFADKQVYETIVNSSAYFFITASFLRTIWKYSERGYRFCLIESGHLVQNINLIAAAKGLSCLNIGGGFYDAEANQFLEINGFWDATLYIACIGKCN